MCVCKKEDFIIFAEFSEVKGPVALFTVPSYIQYDEKIDVNSFIMRIMSVDYQANPGYVALILYSNFSYRFLKLNGILILQWPV